jgi:hypothetical protein
MHASFLGLSSVTRLLSADAYVGVRARPGANCFKLVACAILSGLWATGVLFSRAHNFSSHSAKKILLFLFTQLSIAGLYTQLHPSCTRPYS